MTAIAGRVGAIGDIHAEDDRLAAALTFLRGAHVDRIVAVGDIADGRGDLDRCCALLEDAGVEAVAGNHDRWFLSGDLRGLPFATPSEEASPAASEWLASLPQVRSLATTAGQLLVCHGLGTDDMRGVWPDDAGYDLENNTALQNLVRSASHRWVINGHTHHRMVRRFGDLTIINAGTIHRDFTPCFVIVDFIAREALFYDIAEDLTIVAGETLTL